MRAPLRLQRLNGYNSNRAVHSGQVVYLSRMSAVLSRTRPRLTVVITLSPSRIEHELLFYRVFDHIINDVDLAIINAFYLALPVLVGYLLHHS